MTEYIFTKTSSGDRTNIMASFQLWDKGMFLEDVKKNHKFGRYRYGKIGGWVMLLKDMTLEEFDSIFSPADFTVEQITDIFRKEISLKYGKHAEQAKIKPLGKKDLERGCLYKDFNNSIYLYLGKVRKTEIFKNKDLDYTKEGYGFRYVWSAGESVDFSKLANDAEVLKSIKKLVSKVESPYIELNNKYQGNGWERYSYNKTEITLELL